MPWPTYTLNDGTKMPSLAYGHNYWLDQETIEPDVLTAIQVGVTHLDTAQGYYDEDRFARAIKRSGKQVYVTTKWSRADADIKAACENSLRQLGVEHVDLYLIHGPNLCGNDIPGHWARMELVKKLGYTKSIGVSNFEVHDLKSLVASCSVIPAVNQIQLDPHSYAELLPLMDYCRERNIIVESYSPLILLRDDPEGLVATTCGNIAKSRDAKPEQILMAWCLAKGCAVVTSSHQRSRMEDYLSASEIRLNEDEIRDIDDAGRKATLRTEAWHWAPRLGLVLLAAVIYLVTKSVIARHA